MPAPPTACSPIPRTTTNVSATRPMSAAMRPRPLPPVAPTSTATASIARASASLPWPARTRTASVAAAGVFGAHGSAGFNAAKADWPADCVGTFRYANALARDDLQKGDSHGHSAFDGDNPRSAVGWVPALRPGSHDDVAVSPAGLRRQLSVGGLRFRPRKLEPGLRRLRF